MQALALRHLTKTYKNGIKALKGIDLEVAEGDFFALLGPNGAGKTTAIGIVTSLVNKTSGTVEVFGHDMDRELETAKSCIGVVPQEINFNVFETAFTIVVNQAGFLRNSARAGQTARRKVSQTAAIVGPTQLHRARAVGRDETPPHDRACFDARTAAADSGRAHRRRGHRDSPFDVGIPAQYQRAGHHHHSNHALSGGGGESLPQRRHHRGRPHHRARHHGQCAA